MQIVVQIMTLCKYYCTICSWF